MPAELDRVVPALALARDAAPRSGTLGAASRLLLHAALLASLLLSAQALAVLGIPYDQPEGGFAVKIHPGTWLLLAAWLAALASRGHPLRVAAAEFARHRLLSGHLLCMIACFAWAVAMHGASGMAFYIDTLMVPAVAACVLDLHDAPTRRAVLRMVMLVLLCNALLALCEFVLKVRLVPLHAGRDDIIAEDFFRSSALLGHPLGNALVTIVLLPFLLLMPWPAWLRGAGVLLLALSMLAFGGRSAALLGGGLYLLAGGGTLLTRLLRGRYDYVALCAGLLGGLLGLALLAGGLMASGLGDRIFSQLVWDSSAGVRVQVVHALDHVRGTDFLMGLSIPQIDLVAQRIGLDPRYEAIENFWIYQLLLLGAVVFAVFVAGLGSLMLHLWRRAAPGTRLVVPLYLVLASGANTLSSKNISLLMLTVAVQCSGAFRQDAGRSGRAAA